MATVILPSAVTVPTGAERALDVDAATVGEALRSLEQREPRLRGWLLDERAVLREHVNLFVNDRRADLATPLAAADRVHVLQAISGGSPAGDSARDAAAGEQAELLVGTRKGLYVLRGPRGGEMRIAAREFAGQDVEYALRDPRTGTYFASVTNNHFGPRLFFADRLSAETKGSPWEQADGLAFPEDVDAAVERIWVVEPGAADGELWAGVAPAALFHSTDNGRSWSLNRALWNVPGRAEWGGGMGGLCLHTICPWPGDPRRLAAAISAAGVWITEDGGATWESGGAGLVPRYLPEEARDGATMLCVHDMRRAPREPSTLYMQFHGGVYRSDDGGRRWTDIGAGLPADFGFPIAIDPRDPASAFVIPLNSDQDRVTAEGKVRVYATRDRGASWRVLEHGLPQESAHLTILRQAFIEDGRDPLGLYFGARSGEIFGSADGGETWTSVARNLPPVLSVRVA